MTTPGHITRSASRGVDVADGAAVGWRGVLSTGIALLAVAAGLFLAWQMASSLLVVFAGVLVAALLDACTRALGFFLPIGRGWRLSLVLLILGVLVALGIMWGAGNLPEQIRYLVRVIDAQLDVLQNYLLNFGIELFGPDGGRDFSRWFPDHGRLFGHAQTALGTASGFLTNVAVILFLGILFAFSPHLYRESIVLLVRPSYRARARSVLNEMGAVLQLWLVGQVARILLMTICVWMVLYFIGLPGAFLLGVQAGLSNFIPYLGPIVAAIPIGLVAMPLGVSMLIWSVALYTVVQSIEGYVIGPLILRQAIEIPPAWFLVAIVLFGSLFGVMGIALAVPLVAVGRVALLRFYVEDCLGDRTLADGETKAGDTPQTAVIVERH